VGNNPGTHLFAKLRSPSFHSITIDTLPLAFPIIDREEGIHWYVFLSIQELWQWTCPPEAWICTANLMP